jgi:F-type H+-transporting ATPase subunit epsilon
MKLQLVALDGVKFEEDAYSITLPSLAGEITVYKDHMPLMTALQPGMITIRRHQGDPDYKHDHYASFGGVADINGDRVRILVDEATHGDEINFAEAEKAKAEAERRLANAKNQVELDQAQALIDRYAVRLNVATLRRSHQRRQP